MKPNKINLQRLSGIFSISVILLYLAWLILRNTGYQQNFLISNFIAASCLVFAVLGSFWAYVQLNRLTKPQKEQTISRENIRLKKVWLNISLGLLFWLVGNLARTGYRIFNFEAVFALTALDSFFLIGTIFIWIALFSYPRRPRMEEGRLGLLIDALISVSVTFVLIWVTSLEPILNLAAAEGTNLIYIFYPLSDMFTILVLVSLLLLTSPRYLPVSFFWFSIGMIVFTISDLGYASGTMLQYYQPGRVIDIGWIIGALLFVQVAMGQITRFPTQDFGRSTQALERAFSRVQRFLPLVMVFLLAAFMIFDWQSTGSLDQLSMWMLVILALFLAARQGILAGEVEMRRYASLVNSIAEPAFVCDAKGKLSLVNPAFAQVLGLNHITPLLGHPINELFSPAEEVEELLRKGFSGGSAGELLMLRMENDEPANSLNDEIPVFLSLRPVLPAGSERFVLAGTAHDLSLQKTQQKALLEANRQIEEDRAELEMLNNELEQLVEEKTADLTKAYQQLEQKNISLRELDRLKSDFVSLVSHELRAPLTNINGGIELLLSGKNPIEARSREKLEIVQSEILRLNRFVETILDLSALDAGRMPIFIAPVSLADLQKHFSQNRLLHDERIKWQIADDLPPVLADEQALTSVIFHLLDNARKYAPEGDILVTAGLDEGEDQKMLWLQIADNGPGIPKEGLSRLFERFQRLENTDARQVYGHGLGLYVVQRFMGAMQGKISARNRDEGGAAFTLWLPCDE